MSDYDGSGPNLRRTFVNKCQLIYAAVVDSLDDDAMAEIMYFSKDGQLIMDESQRLGDNQADYRLVLRDYVPTYVLKLSKEE